MDKVLTFGEIMMRLQPSGKKRFLQAGGFEMCFGGGEANVAVSLANFGMSSAYFTKLPENDLADNCIKSLKGLGVDTSLILRGGERMGIYFCEQGASQRPSKIIYDRKNSSVNTIAKAELDFDKIFDGVKWFHFTGITAALSHEALDILTQILQQAKNRKVMVSCDLNYRKNLWSKKEAGKAMSALMQYVDVLFSNEADCKDVFGFEAKGCDIDGGKLSADAYKDIAGQVFAAFPGIKTACFTLRESLSADVNNWSGILVEKGNAYASKKYQINIVDRIGAGDSFAAGVIYALATGRDKQYAIDFAVAASCLKHSIEGDFNLTTVSEAETLMSGGGSGRVQR